MEEQLLPDKLADLCHQQWSGWMEYLFRFGTDNEDGTFTMDADKVERWKCQMATSFGDLSIMEQESDLYEAAKFQDLICQHFKTSIDRMRNIQVRFRLVQEQYKELGLDGVATALETYFWSIFSTARTMLYEWQHLKPDDGRTEW